MPRGRRRFLVQGWVHSSPDGTATTYSLMIALESGKGFLVVQCSRQYTSIAEVTGLILGQELRSPIPYVAKKTEKVKQKNKESEGNSPHGRALNPVVLCSVWTEKHPQGEQGLEFMGDGEGMGQLKQS